MDSFETGNENSVKGREEKNYSMGLVTNVKLHPRTGHEGPEGE